MIGIVDCAFFCFGAIIGSFLNVCIVRMPRNKSIAFPASHCVHCQKPIQWFDNIPLLSWLVLRGKCRQCGKGISFRYWLVELLTAITFVAFYRYFGASPLLGPYLVMMCCFIVATFVDFAERIIPDEVSIGGLAAGVLLSALVPALHPVTADALTVGAFMAGAIILAVALLTMVYPIFCRHLMEEADPAYDRIVYGIIIVALLLLAFINHNIASVAVGLQPFVLSFGASLAGFLVGGGTVLAMGLVGDIVFRKESMGGGDVKLMAMVGAFLGWKLALLAFFLAPFFGAVYGIIEKIRTKDSTMAYGPFLVLGSLVSLFWGEAIIDWIMRGGIYGG